MLTRPLELRASIDALNALINNGDLNSAEELIRSLLKREPALRGKVDVLNALKEGVANADSAVTVLDFIAKKLREFQPDAS
jgi:hypothetical protein